MRIAVPVSDGKVAKDFCSCQQFAFVDVDVEEKLIHRVQYLDCPFDSVSLISRWLCGMCVSIVIAHRMEDALRGNFQKRRIEVFSQSPVVEPSEAIKEVLGYVYNAGKLTRIDAELGRNSRSF